MARVLASASHTRVALALIAFGTTVMTAAQAARSWDGAFFAYTVAQHGVWATSPFDRWTDVIWETPARLALRHTGDVDITLWAFSAGFALIPLGAVVLCWIVTTDRPDLFAWGVLGVCVTCLPGQWFLIAEGQIAIQLGWPLLLAAAAGLDGRRAVVAVLLLPALLWQHPFSAAVFTGAAVLVLLAPYLPGARTSPGRCLWAAGLLALAALRMELVDPGERSLASSARVLAEKSTDGLVRPALVLVLLAAVAMIFRPRDRRARLVAPALLALAGVLLAAHVSSPPRWGDALDYRAAVLFVTAPVGALMTLDLWRAQRPSAIDRGRVAVIAAAVFAAVLAVQAWSWRGEVERLGDAVASGPTCRSIDDVAGEGPLHHWATPYNAVLEQGADVDRLVLLTPELCTLFAEHGVIHLGDFGREYAEVSGAYDFPEAGARP